MIKVLIVDDHALVRLGIRRILEDNDEIQVVGEAASGEEALTRTQELSPDVVLLDVKMPGMGGIEATKRLQRQAPNAKVIAVTAFVEDPFPTHLLKAGASGYLTKECGADEMHEAIRRVSNGEVYIMSEVAQQLALKGLADRGVKSKNSTFEELSERELQVMLMISSGYRVPEISEQLFLSTKTVNSYRYRLFDKFKIKNDVELTHVAIRHGLLDKLFSETSET